MSERCCRLTAPPWALMRVRHPPHVLFTAGPVTETTGLTTVHPRPNACRQPRKPQAWWVMYQQNTLALWRWEHWFNYQCSWGFLLQKCTVGKSVGISGTRTRLSPKPHLTLVQTHVFDPWISTEMTRMPPDGAGAKEAHQQFSQSSSSALSLGQSTSSSCSYLIGCWLEGDGCWSSRQNHQAEVLRLAKKNAFLTCLLRARVQRECHETFLSYSIFTKIRVLFLDFQWGK